MRVMSRFIETFTRLSCSLGSATPSIDSYHLVETGKLTALQPNQRAGHALLPKMHLIDLKIVKNSMVLVSL